MALTQEDLQAIGTLMDNKLEPIHNRMDNIEMQLGTVQDNIEQIKEGMDEVRGSVAAIVDWIDEAGHEVNVRFPVKDKAN